MTATHLMDDADLHLAGHKSYLARFTATHRDDAAYIGWLHDVEVLRTLNLPHYIAQPVTCGEIVAYCEQLMNSQSDLFFAIHLTANDAFVGTLKAARIDRYAGHADIGIMIGRKDLWGQGLATDSVATLCRHMFDVFGLRRLTAGCMATNTGMIRVFEKLGFQLEGIFRKQDRISETEFCDHVHLGCMKDEFIAPEKRERP